MQLSPMILTFSQLGDDRRPFHEALAACRDAGYGEISLLTMPSGPTLRGDARPSVSFIDVFRSDWSRLRQTLADHDLDCRHVHAGGLDVSTAESSSASADALADLAVTAHNFGAQVMTFGIGPRLPEGIGWDDKLPYLDRAAAAFATVADALDGLPIRLGVDIHFRAPVETVRDADHVLTRSGQTQVGLCLNTGHLRSSDQAGWTLITDHPDAVSVVAYKDHVSSGDVHSVRLGQGDTPLGHYLQAIQDTGITPYQLVSIEHEPWEAKDEAARVSRLHLEDLQAQLTTTTKERR